MGLFSLSDVIITLTLLVNAVALLASKTHKESPVALNEDESTETSGLVENAEDRQNETVKLNKFYLFLNWIRRLSCLIVVWNIFFALCMLFVFRS